MDKAPSVFEKKVIQDLMGYYESIFRVCLGFSRDPWDAEELMQEVYLRACQKIHSLKNTNHPGAWLFRIAKNTCLNYSKKKRLSKSFLQGVTEDSVEHITPEEHIIRKEQSRAFKEAVSCLPRKQREVFILKEYGYLSYQEVAGILSVKEGTVMSRLNRARQAVINKLREGNRGESKTK